MKAPEFKNFEKFIQNEEDPNWGRRKGGKININRISDLNVYMRRLREKLQAKSKHVQHIKNVKIKSEIAMKIKKLNLDPLPLIGVMLLTDGYVYTKKRCVEVGYASKDKKLLNLFIEIVNLWKKHIIISVYKKKNNVLCAYFFLPLKNELQTLLPSFKKSPSSNQSIEEYLKESQPSLKFLKKLDKIYKIIAVRIAFSAEGGIGVRQIHPTFKYRLFLSCAHPILNKDWR
ncbi:MAG: hypothetical protein QXL86_03535, partial [Candidatus Aenigmatarchaeota archaeon]